MLCKAGFFMKKHVAKIKNSNKKKWLIIIPLVIAFAICAYLIVSQLADISRLQTQQQAYADELETIEEENEELEAVLESDDLSSYIEEKAREKGYVNSDEEVYYDVSD